MKSPMSRSWMIAAAAGLALLTASCASDPVADDSPEDAPVVEEQTEVQAEEPSSDDTQEAADDDQVAQDAETIEVETVKLEGELVDSFPDDVPLYDGEIFDSSSQMDEVSEAPAWGVMMSTGDSIEVVDAAIREAYSTNGWEIGSDMEYMGGYQLVARHAGYIVSITYNDALSSDIMITYGVSAK